MFFYYALALSLGAYSIWIISLSIRLYAKKCFRLTIEKKIIRLTKSVKLWYCTGICPSICGSVCKACIPWYFLDFACKHDTDRTVSARTVKLGTITSYDKRTTPIAFEGQGSKVKVTC